MGFGCAMTAAGGCVAVAPAITAVGVCAVSTVGAGVQDAMNKANKIILAAIEETKVLQTKCFGSGSHFDCRLTRLNGVFMERPLAVSLMAIMYRWVSLYSLVTWWRRG